jgi:hypothetical protein
MILNASAANGASSDAGRSMSVSSFFAGSRPAIAGHVERRRQEVDHGVEQRLHTLVLERRSADDRHERALALVPDRAVHALPERRFDFVFGDLLGLAVKVFLEDRVVDFTDLLDQLLAVMLGFLEHVGRNVADDVIGAHGFVLVRDRLHLDEIDDAEELVFRADRELDRRRDWLRASR